MRAYIISTNNICSHKYDINLLYKTRDGLFLNLAHLSTYYIVRCCNTVHNNDCIIYYFISLAPTFDYYIIMTSLLIIMFVFDDPSLKNK